MGLPRDRSFRRSFDAIFTSFGVDKNAFEQCTVAHLTYYVSFKHLLYVVVTTSPYRGVVVLNVFVANQIYV